MRLAVHVLKSLVWVLALAAIMGFMACDSQNSSNSVLGRWEVVEHKIDTPVAKAAPKLRFMTFQPDGMLFMEREGPGGKRTDMRMEYEVVEQKGQLLLHLPRLNQAGMKISLRFSKDGKGLQIITSGRIQEIVTLKRMD